MFYVSIKSCYKKQTNQRGFLQDMKLCLIKKNQKKKFVNVPLFYRAILSIHTLESTMTFKETKCGKRNFREVYKNLRIIFYSDLF